MIMFKPILYSLFTCLISSLGLISAQTEEQQLQLQAVARIEAQRCNECPSENDPIQVSTGFLWYSQNLDRPVIVTTLHGIAGANYITYRFTETQPEGSIYETNVLTYDEDADLALLEVLPESISDIQPLTLIETPPTNREVYIFGYKERNLRVVSGETKIKLAAPKLLSAYITDEEIRKAIRKAGYPSLNLDIIPLNGGLDSGDSGAPVFTEGGVIGVAHGGTSPNISWIIGVHHLQKFDGTEGDVADLTRLDIRQVNSILRAYYRDPTYQPESFTNFPSLWFTFEFPLGAEPFVLYGERLEALENHTPENVSKNSDGRYSSYLMTVDDEAFPASQVEPERIDCSRESENILCPSQKAKEQDLITFLSGLIIKVNCFTDEQFNNLIATGQPPSANLILEIPLGDFKEGIKNNIYSWAYEWDVVDVSKIYFYTNNFLEYRPGNDYRYEHSDVSLPDELLNGGCELKLEYKDWRQYEKEQDAINRALARGGVCIVMKLSENENIFTPLSLAGLLPLDEDIREGSLLGALIEGKGTFDEVSCW
jgi:hypothetical protein